MHLHFFRSIILIGRCQAHAKAKTTATFGIKPSSRQIPSERRGRFNVEDFDQVGTIDGTAAHEVDLENIEDKPWRKPGKQNY